MTMSGAHQFLNITPYSRDERQRSRLGCANVAVPELPSILESWTCSSLISRLLQLLILKCHSSDTTASQKLHDTTCGGLDKPGQTAPFRDSEVGQGPSKPSPRLVGLIPAKGDESYMASEKGTLQLLLSHASGIYCDQNQIFHLV